GGVWLVFAAFACLAGCLEPVAAPARSSRGRKLGAMAAGGWYGAGVGLLAGLAANAVAQAWALPLLERFGGLSLPLALPASALLFAVQALPLTVALAIAGALVALGVSRALALPLAVPVAFTYVPAVFPWHPSAPAIRWLAWAQLAEIGGPLLLDALLALAGVGLFWALRGVFELLDRRAPIRHANARRRAAAGSALALATLLLPAGYGWWRLPAVEAERAAAATVVAGVAQPDVTIDAGNDAARALARLQTLQSMTATLEARGAALVVWPEDAYPFGLSRGQARDTTTLPHGPNVRGALVRGPLLFGTATHGDGCDRWNSVVAMDATGAVRGVADKVRLLAFGEYVPLWHLLPPLQARYACPGLRRGRAPAVLPVAGTRVGVLNCYEDVLPRFTRRLAAADPEWLFNATNDAWFRGSAEPRLHLLVARMRSVEVRRDLVRAVNTGPSAFIDATGRVRIEAPTGRAATFLAPVRLLAGRTPWVRFGWVYGPALGLALLATWALAMSGAAPFKRTRLGPRRSTRSTRSTRS
ncbi:MAG: apolipoprotein N-acyltransferase, partial [Myxococcales bacterium]|nr:apolipoprotein N-acyltransferase [Myxococcales bacterium]